MNRIYISGKVTGTTDFKERFADAEEKLRCVCCCNSGFHVVNPVTIIEAMGYDDDEAGWWECMRFLYKVMDECNAIYMMDGWRDSRGARLEHEYAINNGLTIFYEKAGEV